MTLGPILIAAMAVAANLALVVIANKVGRNVPSRIRELRDIP